MDRILISILFVLPTIFPLTLGNLNYTIVAFAVVLGGTTIWWMASAKSWFKGPQIQGTAEELASDRGGLRRTGVTAPRSTAG